MSIELNWNRVKRQICWQSNSRADWYTESEPNDANACQGLLVSWKPTLSLQQNIILFNNVSKKIKQTFETLFRIDLSVKS